MYINYTIKKFPIVHVCINDNTDINNDSYEKFIRFWENQYEKKEYFKLFINLENLSKPDLSLILDFTKRMNVLKSKPIQYLTFSIMIVQNTWIIEILSQIWTMSPPLNTVYIVPTIEIGSQLLNNLYNPRYNEDHINTYLFINNITKII